MTRSRFVRWSVVAALGLCASTFGAAILITQRSASELQGVLAEISENAVPSVDRLTYAGDLLERLHVRLLHLRTSLAEGRVPPFDATLALADLEHAVQEAGATSRFPAEKELRNSVGPALAHVKELTLQIEDAVRGENRLAAINLIDRSVPVTFNEAAVGLHSIMQISLEGGRRSARHAEELWLSSRHLAYALGATASLLTLAIAVLLLLTMRRFARMESTQLRRKDERSLEMELFAARVAHDIRSPLSAALLTCSHARRTGVTPEKLLVMLNRIESGLRRTSALVDGLYEFARAGGETAGQASTPLRDSVDHVVEDVSSRAHEAGVSLLSDAIPDCRVAASPGVVSSILLNLVCNGIRYAGPGARITVRARAGDNVEVDVEDTGPGIPLDAQARILRPFTREDGAPGHGLGLGLATVKRLVEAHGGTCGVRSNTERGSTFWFVLPRARQAGAALIGSPSTLEGT